MNKNVIISVKGIQTSGNKVVNTLELVTEGKYYKKATLIMLPTRKAKLQEWKELQQL